MKLFFSRSIIMLIGIFFSFNSYAWNALGHQVIANIAYQYLQPLAREKVDRIVADFSREYPAITNFTQLASWPDTLRRQKIELFTHWHYIDMPFSDDGTPLKNRIDTDNVVWAINQIEPVIKNKNANAFERARFLAFFIHIVGDIHQPLHTSSRLSAAHPFGDQGGNLFFIQSPAIHNLTIPLHRLWDNAFAANIDPSASNVSALTQEITAKYPPEFFGEKINDPAPQNWADEGAELCRTIVYNTQENGLPTPAYMHTKQQVSEQRLALAGYRLANSLNLLLANNNAAFAKNRRNKIQQLLLSFI